MEPLPNPYLFKHVSTSIILLFSLLHWKLHIRKFGKEKWAIILSLDCVITQWKCKWAAYYFDLVHRYRELCLRVVLCKFDLRNNFGLILASRTKILLALIIIIIVCSLFFIFGLFKVSKGWLIVTLWSWLHSLVHVSQSYHWRAFSNELWCRFFNIIFIWWLFFFFFRLLRRLLWLLKFVNIV